MSLRAKDVRCLTTTSRNALTRDHVVERTAGGDNDKTTHLTSEARLGLAIYHIYLVMKRSCEEGDEVEHSTKVRRVVKVDRLSRLSDELLVRILSFLPVSSLLTSQR